MSAQQPARLPQGFAAHVGNIGIKDHTDDVCVLASDVPCTASAVFTRSRFAGPSVEISRTHAADGTLRAIVVVSKNANVANGPQGHAELSGIGGQLLGQGRTQQRISQQEQGSPARIAAHGRSGARGGSANGNQGARISPGEAAHQSLEVGAVGDPGERRPLRWRVYDSIAYPVQASIWRTSPSGSTTSRS
jgi:hypothetical protein